MIEGKSLAKTADTLRGSSDDGVPLAASVSRAPSDDKPRRSSGIVEADETFILESFQGRWSDLPRKAQKRGGTARHPGPYQDTIPVLVARDREGATLDAVLPQADGAAIAAVLKGIVTPGNHLVGDGGKRWPSSPAEPGFLFTAHAGAKAMILGRPGMLVRMAKRSGEAWVGFDNLEDCRFDGGDPPVDLFEALSVVTLQQRERQGFSAVLGGGAILTRASRAT